MTIFHYKAKKGASEIVTGQVNAHDKDEAVELVSQLGLLPISVEEHRYAHNAPRSIRRPSGSVSHKDLLMFSRQLASLLKAGISLLRALEIIRDQAANPHLKDTVNTLRQNIQDGQSFSDALSGYPRIFNFLYVAMVRAGEEGGSLQDMLLRLCEHQKNQQALMSKVRSAVAYPILMAVVGAATIFFILTFVMPKITHLLQNTGSALPLPTVIVMAISHFLRVGWLWIALVLLIAVVGMRRWLRTTNGRTVVNTAGLRIPLFGELILKAELARFCRTLELLLHSGISLLKAINTAIPIIGNDRLKQELSVCQKDLAAGLSLGESFRQISIIPAMVAHLIIVGEESGSLEETLHDIADNYEQETNDTVQTLTTLIEPLMILIVGLVVGFIVIAMLLPIFQMDILAR